MKKLLNHIRTHINNYKHLKMAKVLLLIIFIVAGHALNAQQYPEAYLDDAINNNPAINAKLKAYEADLQEINIARTLPDPQLAAGIFTPSMSRLMGDQWFDVEIMQMFPWFGTLNKQKNAAQELSQKSFHEYRLERNTVFMEITTLWLRIYQKEQQIKLIDQFVKNLKAKEDLIYSRYEGGKQKSGLTLDIYRMEIQLAELYNRKKKLNEDIISLTRSFNILIKREELSEIETPASLKNIDKTEDSEKIQDSFENNPGLNMAQSSKEAAKINRDISKLKTRPMMGIGLKYSYFSEGDPNMGQMDGGHMIMPMISVSLPIYRSKNQARVQKAELFANAADYREEEQLNKLQIEWTNIQSSLKNLQNDYGFYSEQLEITYKTWDLITAGYASGDEGFDELLRVQDQLIELEWRILNTIIEQHILFAKSDMLQAKNVFK
ncbi:MAG: TolC family protein [Bacteroidales bacterium]